MALKPCTTVERGLPEIREASELKMTALEGLTKKAGECVSLESSESWTGTNNHAERFQDWLWKKKNAAVIWQQNGEWVKIHLSIQTT